MSSRLQANPSGSPRAATNASNSFVSSTNAYTTSSSSAHSSPRHILQPPEMSVQLPKKKLMIVTNDVHMEEEIDGVAQLFNAIERNRLTTVKYLLDQGLCDVNDTDAEGWTALMVAADQGFVHIVHYLIQSGAILDLWNLEGKSAVILGCERGYFEVVHCLVEHRADILAQNKKTGWTALMIATFFGRIPIVQYFLSKIGNSAAVNVQRTEDGWTALMMAGFFGHLHIAKLLLDHGASLESLNFQGSTPLMLATLRNHEQIVYMFLHYGANVNAQNIYGLNILMIAAERGYFPLVQFFVEKAKINLQAQDQNGYTALMIASTSHQVPSEIIHYLIKQGSQLFMQEAGDEVTNHQSDRIPKFSSFIRPLMAGLLKTFVYAPMGNTPPRFVYRYVVISVEGFLLYFDTSSSDSQDHVPLEQADNKLPLFHSSNIHGKMNLNDLSYTIAIKSANQEDVDISEVLSNSSSQANVGSSASPRQKVLRRLYSKDEMIGSYLHTSPSSSPKGKARHLLESIAEDNTTVIASPQTKASDQSSSSKASKPQLDFPIEFNIPSLSFTWIFYTENVMEQIRWYTAFMKFLRYDKTDNVAGTVIKLKKAPMLPPQVNTHPSTRRSESILRQQPQSPSPLSPLPQPQPSFPFPANNANIPPPITVSTNNEVKSSPNQLSSLQSPTSASARKPSVASAKPARNKPAPTNPALITNNSAQAPSRPSVQFAVTPEAKKETKKTPKSAASMYHNTSFHYRVQHEGVPVDSNPTSPKMSFKPLRQILDEKKVTNVVSSPRYEVIQDETISNNHCPATQAVPSISNRLDEDFDEENFEFDECLFPKNGIRPEQNQPASKEYVMGGNAHIEEDEVIEEPVVVIPKKSRKSIRKSFVKGLYYLSSSFSAGSKSKNEVSDEVSVEAGDNLPFDVAPASSKSSANDWTPSRGKGFSLNPTDEEEVDELEIDDIGILEAYLNEEKDREKQMTSVPSQPFPSKVSTAKKPPRPPIHLEDAEDDSTIGEIYSVQSLHVEELQDDLTQRRRSRTRSDASKFSVDPPKPVISSPGKGKKQQHNAISSHHQNNEDDEVEQIMETKAGKGQKGRGEDQARASFATSSEVKQLLSPSIVNRPSLPSTNPVSPSALGIDRLTTTPISLTTTTAARRKLLLVSKKSFKRLNSFKRKGGGIEATNHASSKSSKMRRIPSRRTPSPSKVKRETRKGLELDSDLLEDMDNPMKSSPSPVSPTNRQSPLPNTNPKRRTVGGNKILTRTGAIEAKTPSPIQPTTIPDSSDAHCQCTIQ